MNILAVPPVLDQKIVKQVRVRLDAQPVPADLLKGLRHGIDARIRPGLHKKTAAPRPVHTIYDLVEFFMCCFADELLLVEGARASMRAELRLSSKYPGEGGEPAPHGSVCEILWGDWAGACLPGLPGSMRDWAAFTGKGLPGPVRVVDN